MKNNLLQALSAQTEELKANGLYKDERIITSQQQALISVKGGQEVLNFCANNYLGLANNPDLIETGKKALDKYGFGLSSVRFICGTQDVHKALEKESANFLKPKTQFFTALALTPMAAFSKQSSPKKMRLSAIP